MKTDHTFSDRGPGEAKGPRGPQPIQRQAAEWLALHQARGLTPAEQAAFAEWSQDPRHAAMYAEVASAWTTFDRLSAYPGAQEAGLDPDLLAPRRRIPQRTWGWLGGSLAAAAAIALAASWWTGREYSALPDASPPSLALDAPRSLLLSDGSSIELNTGSEVIEQFTESERRVQLLKGEAHFTVTRNVARPFIVEVEGVAVRAVGTAFNVRLEASVVEVLVTAGVVQVDRPQDPSPDEAEREETLPEGSETTVRVALEATKLAPPLLGVGQRTRIPLAPAATEVAPLVVETLETPEIDRALAWQASRLVFDETSLAEVVTRFNHYAAGQARPLQLQLGDDQVGRIRVSGRIRSDNVESFVEVLESSFGVTAERRSDGSFVLRQAR